MIIIHKNVQNIIFYLVECQQNYLLETLNIYFDALMKKIQFKETLEW